jgi:SAM-dependent methyltransferase
VSARTAYDVVDRYDEAYFADLAARYRRRNRFARQRLANVFSLLPRAQGLRVLDLGCGMGTFTIETARRGAIAIGIDPMPAAIAAATHVARAEEVTGARFVRADAARLPIASDSVDLVLAADFTEHLDDGTFERVLAEASRALRSGGLLVIYTPERTHLFERLKDRGIMTQDPSHIGVRSDEELARAVRAAGFRDVAVTHLPSHQPVWNALERLLAPRVPLLRRRIGLTAMRP